MHNSAESKNVITTDYRTIGMVAAELSMPRWRLAYLIDRGDVPGPSLQAPGRRLFSEADVARIQQALAMRLLKAPSDGPPSSRARSRTTKQRPVCGKQ
jgi:hypothetical protein